MKASHFSPDIQEFVLLLSRHKVNYVIVGGEAVIYYGLARLTGDVDFFYDSTAENARKLYSALYVFWDGSIPNVQSPEDLMAPNLIIQFGLPPNRIDLVSAITGVPFKKAWTSRATEKLKIRRRTCSVHFIGLAQLIKNKEAVKRNRDLEDLKFLKAAARKLNEKPRKK